MDSLLFWAGQYLLYRSFLNTSCVVFSWIETPWWTVGSALFSSTCEKYSRMPLSCFPFTLCVTGICTCANINNGDYYPSGSGLVSLYCLGHFVARTFWTGVKSTSFSGCVCVFGVVGGTSSLNLALPHNVSFQLLNYTNELAIPAYFPLDLAWFTSKDKSIFE